MADRTSDMLEGVLDALARTTDPAAWRAALERRLPGAPSPQHGDAGEGVLSRIVLSDILDDDILGARPEDRAFPLRALLGDLAQALVADGSADAAFAFASGLNFYFRAAAQTEELRIGVGLATSQLYYAFMAARGREPREVAATSPLLAALLSGELERVKFESVDQAKTFDGQVHEREPGSPSAATIRTPLSFLCRITATGVVRSRALVRT